MKPTYMSQIADRRAMQRTMRRELVTRVAARDGLTLRERLALIDALRCARPSNSATTATERFSAASVSR